MGNFPNRKFLNDIHGIIPYGTSFKRTSGLPMTSLNIENWPIDRIRPFADNVHLHTDEQVHFITQSILQFGFVNPILVDANGECIAGHGRLQAMRLLDRNEVPVIVLGHLTQQQANAYRIADNRIPLTAQWDEALYRKQLEDFMSSGFPMESIGWGAAALDEFLSIGNKGLTDPDEAPEPSQHPSTRLGDLWKLGEHRLLVGDCTKASNVKNVYGKAKCNLMVTDPPYGIDYDPDWRRTWRNADGSLLSTGKHRALGRPVNDMPQLDWRAAWQLFDGDVAYCWHAGVRASTMQTSFEESGFNIRCQIIWAKQHFVVSRGDYHSQHEPCFYLVRKGRAGGWTGDRKQTTLWEIDKNLKSETGHSTQKPIECMKRPMENNSRPGDYVYDPFVGSGTTIIAAEMLGRRCLAIEIDPTFAQVSIERWQKFTGQQAKLNGKTFSEVVQERADAISDSGIPVQGENVVRPVAKRKVRAALSAPQSRARRSAVRKPPAVHAKRRPQRQ